MLRGAGDFVQELALLLGCEDVGRAATEHLVDAIPDASHPKMLTALSVRQLRNM